MNEQLLEPQSETRMEETAPAKPRLKLRNPLKGLRGKKKRWLLLLVIAVAGGAVTVRLLSKPQTASAVTSYQEETVSQRDIVNSLSSSGTLQPADSYTVSTLVSGEILSDTFEEGDLVEEGQLLYTLDSSDASTSQSQAQNSYAQAQKSYSQAVKAKYPTADLTGTVSEVYVKNGDTVNAGTELMTIVGDNNLYINFLFTYADTSDFYVGQTATIFINGMAGTITGTVTAVSSGSTASDTGKMITTVRVKAQNPGLVTSAYTASAVIGSYSSYGNASIEMGESSAITAETSGKVTNMNWLGR